MLRLWPGSSPTSWLSKVQVISRPLIMRPATEDLEDLANSAGMLFTPLTNYQYSNIGMAMLGKVVAEVSGQDYGEYVECRCAVDYWRSLYHGDR